MSEKLKPCPCCDIYLSGGMHPHSDCVLSELYVGHDPPSRVERWNSRPREAELEAALRDVIDVTADALKAILTPHLGDDEQLKLVREVTHDPLRQRLRAVAHRVLC